MLNMRGVRRAVAALAAARQSNRRPTRGRHPAPGFSVTEVLASLAIMGILATIGVYLISAGG